MRRSPPSPPPHGRAASDPPSPTDAPVIATADDAILAKLSASLAGYYSDPFLPHFAGGASGLTTTTTRTGGRRVGVGSAIPDDDEYDDVDVEQQRRRLVHPRGGGAGPGSSPRHPHHAGGAHRHPHRHRHGHRCGGGGGGDRGTRETQPVIRRGTHARVCVIDRAIAAFLALGCDDGGKASSGQRKRQVVVLGAGRDTSYLRYRFGFISSTKDDGTSTVVQGDADVRWYEVDHPSVAQMKAELLSSCTSCRCEVASVASDDDVNGESCSFSVSVGEEQDPLPENGPSQLSMPENSDTTSSTVRKYHIVGYDLRRPVSSLLSIISQRHGFDPRAPALFVLECVQMYLPDKSSRDLLSTVASLCPNAFVALYDPILLGDPFGAVMERHLTRAGIGSMAGKSDDDNTIGLFKCRTLDQQLDKLMSSGFGRVVGCDMLAAYETVVRAGQRQKANRCEMLDEIEEWVLIMRHYCFAVGAVGGANGLSASMAREFCSLGTASPLGFVKGKCTIRIPDGTGET